MNKEYLINNYRIEKLTEKHRLTDFQSGNPKLDNFLKYDAFEQQLNRFNVTYLAICDETILGYYCLLADNIKLKKVDFNIPKEYKNAPAIKIGQFARDLKFDNRGFGTELLDQACKFIKSNFIKFDIKYVTVDSYVTARKFYKKNDFEYVKNIDFEKLEKAEKRDPKSVVNMYKNLDYI